MRGAVRRDIHPTDLHISMQVAYLHVLLLSDYQLTFGLLLFVDQLYMELTHLSSVMVDRQLYSTSCTQ